VSTSKLASNVMHFGRLLRRAGLSVGPGHVIDAMKTVEAVGIDRRDDVYWALHAAFVKRREEHELFDAAFRSFWRDPFGENEALALLLPHSKIPEADPREETFRRLMEAWHPPRDAPALPPEARDVELEATMTYSDVEQLKKKDFEQMSAAEIARARKIIARMRFGKLAVKTRRRRPNPRGDRLDLRRMLRMSLRSGGRDLPLAKRGRTTRPPPLVAICDISGSMERYSRMLLSFLHAMTNDRDRVTTFVFGTRLTNITRALCHRDVDLALRKIGGEVKDWSGGTRIGACLREFNLVWSRRVLAQGALVLLISDGLDRESSTLLSEEAARLRRSCRRLIWLNPLLRFEGFEPTASGIGALLPHVDELRTAHNLESLEDLASALDVSAGRSTGLQTSIGRDPSPA
jgi:uncharacterized protein